MKSTPEMMLAKFVAENNNDKIKVNADIGEVSALYVWAKSNGNLVSLYSAISVEKLTHFKLNHWIFQANQEIEQYIAAQEMALLIARGSVGGGYGEINQRKKQGVLRSQARFYSKSEKSA